MQTRSSDQNYVCLSAHPCVHLSVRLSNATIVTKRKKNHSKFYTILYQFSAKKGWRGTSSTGNFALKRPRWSEIADFQSIFARSVSAVTSSEKSSLNTNMKSTTCFPMSLRSSSSVAPKPSKWAESGLKTQNGRFLGKIALRLEKSLLQNCQRQSCEEFSGLTIGAKNDWWGDCLYLKFWVKLTALERNRRFSIYFRS